MYYEKIALAIGVCALVANLAGAPHKNWTAEAHETIHHIFSGDKTLDVDNTNGTILVTGDGGNSIRIDAEKIIRAASQQEVDRAKREVTLDINEKNGVAQLYVNGPFRDNSHRSQDHGFHERGDREYEVTYNFTIHVPRETALELRSLNGEVKSTETSGKFDVHGVNGAVTLTDIAGSGSVNTVNGPLVISFRENPKAATDFRTVNGRIEATFQPNLSADLRLKTLNGAMYTDFDVTAQPIQGSSTEQKNGKFIYKSNRNTSVRAGAGGPELSFETVNGAITIKKGMAR